MSAETSGEWREERLYVLRAIEDLKAEQRRQIEEEAVMRQVIQAKAEKDINAAHSRIRVLENASTEQTKEGGILTIKNWVMAGILSTAGVVLLEVLKWVITKK
jgi:hypothetical protein